MTTTYRPEDDRPHVDVWMCGKCRKSIEKGHRVIQVLISQGRTRNPMDLQHEGLNVSSEWEFIHADCNFPFLRK